jgi:hypothetical protein
MTDLIRSTYAKTPLFAPAPKQLGGWVAGPPLEGGQVAVLAEVQLAAGLVAGLGTLSIELTNDIMPPFPELTVTPYERRCPTVMSKGPELVG